ncbi:hypothetical protein LUZ61_018338 [Rhynchospora tenuis]|uniref:DUF6817 domain-containing protein n=1 Tax=Rhynchospora tenuis TaxID=198213 RepID=A0AAD5Z9C0_9POAL|nr:hypothetical protein LUZ61_018338 [Rhynchospora tenuis]
MGSETASPVLSENLSSILAAARPFLRSELASIDPSLPSFVDILHSVGADECWHKHSTFFSHLFDIYRILKLWRTPDSVARCGLFHSAYSNSYVNLAIFDPGTSRSHARSLIGEEAERLVYLFCVVPRQQLIHDDLLFHYSDSDLKEHLALSENSVKEAKEKGIFDADQAWRKKVQDLLPAEGIKVKHIKTGEEVLISRRQVAVFVLMTMADFSDQLFQWQDKLFENEDGKLEFKGSVPSALWPGEGKPGLWMSSISRMGVLYSLIAREEKIYIEERKQKGVEHEDNRDEEIVLVIPPVFDYCTKVLDAKEQILARDLYWKAVCSNGDDQDNKVERLLIEASEKNPFVGEPRLVLAQVYLNARRYEEAEKEAAMGLRLILEWGSCWDKRMTWEGWISWGRQMLGKAKERDWPTHAWGILNLGLVK